MYFLNDTVDFVVKAKIVKGLVELPNASIQLRYYLDPKAETIVSAFKTSERSGTRQLSNPKWWTLKENDPSGVFTNATLTFHGEAFTGVMKDKPTDQDRVLYETFLEASKLQLSVEYQVHDCKPEQERTR